MRNIVFVPEKVDIGAITAFNPPDFPFKIDKFNKIMHSLCVIPAFNKQYQKFSFIPLNTKVLKQSVRDYKPYLSYLIENGIIESNESYEVGKISKGFRYTPTFSSEVTPEFITDFTLKKNINDYWNSKYNKQDGSSFLKKWFVGLEFDFGKATDFLQQLHALERDYYISKVKTKKAIKNRAIKATQRYNSRFIIASMLNQFTLLPQAQKKTNNPAHRDHNVKRYHTLMTTMKSELRNFITYKGEELVNIDISNSQPYLINGLLRPEFWSPSEDEEFNIKLFKSKSFYDENNVNLIKYIMLHVPEESIDTTELENFQEITSSGNLYHYLYEQMKELPEMEALSYKELKQAILAMLYSENVSHYGHIGIAKKVFTSNFPTIYKLLCQIKSRHKECLPILLQRMESHLIIDKIAVRINKEHPTVPIFTVHDSIATTKSNVKLVQQIMTEEMEKTIGISAKLKEEPWNCWEAKKSLKQLEIKYRA